MIKQKKRKIFAVLLIAVLLITSVPLESFAEKDSGAGNGIITETDNNSEEKIISDTDTESGNKVIPDTDTESENKVIPDTDTESDNKIISELNDASEKRTIQTYDQSEKEKAWIPDTAEISGYSADFGRVKLVICRMEEKYPLTYQVKYWKKGSEKGKVRNFKEPGNSVIVDGLEYNGKYKFKIRALYTGENDEKITGGWSNSITCYANSYGNKSQDIIKGRFTKIRTGKTHVKISVRKAPFRKMPENLKYEISYRMSGEKEFKKILFKSGTTAVRGMERGTEYQFKTRYYYKSPLDGKRVYSRYSPVKKVRLALPVSDVLDIARSWIGKNEKSGSFKSIIDLYNEHDPLARGYSVKYCDEWCATTVSAVFIKAHGSQSAGGTECGVQRYIDLFRKKGIWEEDGRIRPKPGYLICYNWDDKTQENNGWADHIGIVEKVKGNKITVIEGNYKEKVGRRVIPVKWGYIRGYAKPRYTDSRVYS